jgi:hypothetical protein
LGRLEKSILIKAPPKTVWEILAFDRLPEWSEGFGERIEYARAMIRAALERKK